MLKSPLLLALYALVFAVPARAELLPYTLSGTISGTQTTVVCVLNPNEPPCFLNTPFTLPFVFTEYLDLDPGLNEFQFGSAQYSFIGTILNENGELSGLNMRYGERSCGPAIPGPGCFWRSGTAPTFVVQPGAGVPEPATWLFMLLGFGLVATRLRAGKRKSHLHKFPVVAFARVEKDIPQSSARSRKLPLRLMSGKGRFRTLGR